MHLIDKFQHTRKATFRVLRFFRANTIFKKQQPCDEMIKNQF